ncbi:MAG: class I tRNA ligase family protein, partial [Candidatus Aenigmatarchaeota archaeon]
KCGDTYEKYYNAPEKGENLEDVRKRMLDFILDIEKKYEGRNILIVSHELPLRVLFGEMQALSKAEVAKRDDLSMKNGELKEVELLVLPRDGSNEINIHRPYIDNVMWKCKCGGIKKRVEELVDIWFDSGCAPFSAYHYPFENKNEIDNGMLYPLDFILEGIDQTRGWFYTLFVIGLLIKGVAPYRNVMSYGMVVDKIGRKMSKSLGNIVNPITEIEKYSGDLLRYYFLYLSEPIENKKYDEDLLKNLKNGFFDLILNILNFYRTYYIKTKKKYKNLKSDMLIDKWFDIRIKETYNIWYSSLLEYNFTKPVREIFNLVQDLSHWWLRRSRKRFQKQKNIKELSIALLKLEEYLYHISKLLAPFTPFFSEFLYQEIKNEIRDRINTELSVHLENIKNPPTLSTKEKQILKYMEIARKITSSILMLRKTNNIKIRQPLKDVYIGEKLDENYLELIKDEVNVKKIYIGKPKNKENYLETSEPIYVWLNKVITPELKEEGVVNDFIRYVQDLRKDLGLTHKKEIFLCLEVNENLKSILKKNKKLIMENTNSKNIEFSKPKNFDLEKQFIYENFGKVNIWIKIIQ